jgi:hypothetical protein
MAQDLSNFISEVWSQKLTSLLDNSGVMMQCVNRNYEGEIKNAGDTVHIRTFGDVTVKSYSGTIAYDELTSPTQTLSIDQKKYFAFKVDDISKAQSNVDIMSGYLQRAKVAIDLAKDAFLLAKHVDVPAGNIIGSDSTPIALSKDTIYTNFVALAKALKKTNATSKGQKPWIVINPDIEALLIQAPEFIQANQTGDKTLKEGSIGRIAGLDVLVCTNLTATAGKYYVLAGTNDAVTFASQVVEIESIRLQDSFDTAVRGLYVYGAKTILPNALAKLVCTIS